MFINKINDLYKADNVKLELFSISHYVQSFKNSITYSLGEMHSAVNVVLSLTYSESFDDVSIFNIPKNLRVQMVQLDAISQRLELVG